MARIDFTAHYVGDDATRHAVVHPASVAIEPLVESSLTGEPGAVRVRASGLSEADIARLTGTGWTQCSVEQSPTERTLAGEVSALEVDDGGELSFVLNPAS